GVFPFDARWWNQARSEHGRDPLATLVEPGSTGELRCPRCGGPIAYDPARIAAAGWAPARHGMPIHGACAVSGHFVAATGRRIGSAIQTSRELRDALEGRLERAKTWRLADQVEEPED